MTLQIIQCSCLYIDIYIYKCSEVVHCLFFSSYIPFFVPPWPVRHFFGSSSGVLLTKTISSDPKYIILATPHPQEFVFFCLSCKFNNLVVYMGYNGVMQ